MKAVVAVTLALSAFAATTVQAAGYPDKAVTMIVPYPAGGSSDMVARIMSARVSEKLGQPVVIDNRAGANGAIGATMVKRAAADGYTMLVAAIGVYSINPFLQKGLQYDPVKDFDLLTLAVRAPNVLVMNPAMPAKNLNEFVGYLKKLPGKVTFASSGAGSSDHLTAALFWQRTGTSGLHVPYKGGAPAIVDLLGGHADASFQNINAILQHVRAGKLKALGITADKRAPVLPQVPTMAEGGVKDVVVSSWQAVAAPKGLPKDVKSTLHAALAGALNDPQNRQRMTDLGFDVVASSPVEFDKFLGQELARWKAVIEAGNISLE
jgi:tripartite-type tricarboxylate transporter receptor subunit TctC